MKNLRFGVMMLVCMLVSGGAFASEVKLSGQIRFRPEMNNNRDFNDAKNDKMAFIGQRVLLNVNAKVDDYTEAFVQIQDSRIWGSAANTKSSDGAQSLDLFQAYFRVEKLFNTPIDMKVGRQTLVYGDQRLLGHLGWKDNGRSFDAFKFTYKSKLANVDFFTAKLKDNGFPASGSTNDDLYGIYSTFNLPMKNNLDLYYLLWEDDSIKRKVTTYGARLNGKKVNIDYTAELAIQGGDWKSEVSQKAIAFAVKAGISLEQMSTRIGVEFDKGSGDDDMTDNEHKSFVFPFHTNHAHYGYMDFFSWGNMQDIQVNVKTQPLGNKLTVKLAYHIFSFAESKDDWLNVVGNNPNPGFGSGDYDKTDVGSEIDLTIIYPYSKKFKIVSGYSIFSPGDAVEERNRGDVDSSTWAYTMLILNI